MAWGNSSQQFSLTGTGLQTISYYAAWNITISVVPSWASAEASTAVRYHHLGWIAFGVFGYGYKRIRPLEFVDMFVDDFPLGTNRMAYRLEAGVTILGYGLTWS